jgi:hypothetical protein
MEQEADMKRLYGSAGVAEKGKGKEYVTRQMHRWKQYTCIAVASVESNLLTMQIPVAVPDKLCSLPSPSLIMSINQSINPS